MPRPQRSDYELADEALASLDAVRLRRVLRYLRALRRRVDALEREVLPRSRPALTVVRKED
jgi:hypothetical protein